MKLLGIDEAGRGCVIGPMILCGVLLKKHFLNKLNEFGVKDSKELSHAKRYNIFKLIKPYILKYLCIKISPKEIDNKIINQIEIENTAKIINRLKPDIVYLDVPVNKYGIKKYCNKISSLVNKKIKIIGENNADKKYKIVAAASIIAKVKRENEIKRIKKYYNDFGSGYPSDKRTINFLINFYERHKFFPDIVRKKWKTIQKIKPTM
jgi:ribonuclease HII